MKFLNDSSNTQHYPFIFPMSTTDFNRHNYDIQAWHFSDRINGNFIKMSRTIIIDLVNETRPSCLENYGLYHEMVFLADS